MLDASNKDSSESKMNETGDNISQELMKGEENNEKNEDLENIHRGKKEGENEDKNNSPKHNIVDETVRVYPKNYTGLTSEETKTETPDITTRKKRKLDQIHKYYNGDANFKIKESDSLDLKHPSSEPYFKKITEENKHEFVHACGIYLEQLSLFKCRKSRERKTVLDCHCLKDICKNESTLNRTTSLILAHACRSKGTQGLFIKEWIRTANVIKFLRPRGQKKQPCFVLLGVEKDERKKDPYFLCSNAFCAVLGIGSSRWEGLKQRLENYEEEVHGLCGKDANRKMDPELSEALFAFFARRKQEAHVHKGKRESIKYHLPTNSSKRKEYQQFCWERGWRAKASKTGDYGALKTFARRSEFDESWLETDTKVICSWSKFKDFWSFHFSEIVINTTADCKICGLKT